MGKSYQQLQAAIDAADQVQGLRPQGLAMAVFFGKEWLRDYAEMARRGGTQWAAAGARSKAKRIHEELSWAAIGISSPHGRAGGGS